jgi:hypothetical protein
MQQPFFAHQLKSWDESETIVNLKLTRKTKLECMIQDQILSTKSHEPAQTESIKHAAIFLVHFGDDVIVI